MSNVDLDHLTSVTEKALRAPHILDMIALLKAEILKSKEPFIWKDLSEQLPREGLPNGIQSAWIFVLKPNITNPAHHHPNSAQHMAVIEGVGKIRIGREEKKIQIFDPQGNQPTWYIIPKNVSHAVTTKKRVMVVFSFHTCPSKELLEVEILSGRSRLYES